MDMEHLLPEDIVGQRGLDILDTNLAQIPRCIPDGPRHHVDVGNSPTKVNASTFITQALEDNWSDAQQSDIYAEYTFFRST